MPIGVCFLAVIFCLLCGGGLDIFMAVTNYKEGKYFEAGTWLTTWVIQLFCLRRIILGY